MENFEVVLRSALLEFKEEMQESIKKLESDINEVKSDVNETKSEAAKIISNLNEVKSDVNEIKSDVNEIKSDIKRIYLRLDANDARLASLEYEVKRLNFSADAFRNRFQYLEEDLTSVKQS